MTVEIVPLGGLGEVGKNMTAIGFDGTYVLVDMGIRLETILGFDDVNIGTMGREELIRMDGIPDDSSLRDRNVVAILLTHGHLDHIGAIGKLAHAYDAPIYGTPFTVELAKYVVQEERAFKVTNEFRKVRPGGTVDVGDLRAEFIEATHSIPQSTLVAVHGPDGAVLCASDFKLDDEPPLGPGMNYDRLRSLANDGLLAALVGAVRVDEVGPTPPEVHAQEMLRKSMSDAASGRKAVVVTTFSSHIARVKSIVDISYEIGRTPVVLGRSLHRYCMTAVELGLVEFPPDLQIHGNPKSVRNALKKVKDSREDYVLLVTGHQGEPTALLTRIADERLPLRIGKGDEVIFSASIIPNPLNISNRELLETKLRAQGARVRRDVHVSGHAGRSDTKEFIKLVAPEHLVPCHATFDKLGIVGDIGRELGYDNEQLHLLRNGERLSLGA
jgi:ribonuclease J